ncbi:hypothetical protein Pfo_003876 [Paulownia fortunei]|nr:hypothetical protein Pfo_003876 [Paulownia fortunei]
MASSPTPSSPSNEQQSFPAYLSSVNVGNFVSCKLWGDKQSNNYSSWKQQMLCLIESQDLLRFIDGKIPPPQPPLETTAAGDGSKDYVVWRTDRLLKGWILGALGDTVLKTVANFATARDVWLELEKNFSVSGPAHVPSRTPAEEEEWHSHLPLYRATLMGDWNRAKGILDQDPNAIKARIAFTLETTLHIAVGTGKVIHFVEKLVDLMPDDLLELKDELGYTALHVAALTGNTAAAKILVGRRPGLLYVPDNIYRFPVHMAAQSAHRETLWYLISQTKDDFFPSPYLGETGLRLLCTVIDADIFDVALYLVEKYSHLATLKLGDGNSALKRIALKDSAFSSGRLFNFWERVIYSRVPVERASKTQYTISNAGDIEDPAHNTSANGRKFCVIFEFYNKRHKKVQNSHATLCKVIEQLVPRVKAIRSKKQIHQEALNLVKCLCKNMESLDYRKASEIYVDVMLTAARLGVHEVIEVIVATFPAAIYSRDFYTRQYIFHVAVENRSEKVFNLIHQTSDHKHQYSDLTDSSGNTLLHLAARLAPPHKLNLVSGAALQMQREIQWFKEVEKFLHPYSRERSNNAGKTPKMVFTEEHITLKAEGEKWMKDTANSCTIAAALIATVVFAAAITVPGGNEANTGFPFFSNESAFIIFAISDAISLFTSTTSLLMFLSILTSRYAEEDFLYALPKRLSIGLVTLFVSISFMMAAFSATLYLVFARKKAWILIPVAALACLPVTSFVLLQFPLLVDVISNTYGRGIFGKQSNRPFY